MEIVEKIDEDSSSKINIRRRGRACLIAPVLKTGNHFKLSGSGVEIPPPPQN